MKILIHLSINGEITTKEKNVTSMMVTRGELLEGFNSPPVEQLFCWIMCPEQKISIKTSNDLSFTNLISALSYEYKLDTIEVLFNNMDEQLDVFFTSIINEYEPFTREKLRSAKDLVLIPSYKRQGKYYAFFPKNLLHYLEDQLNKDEDFFSISYTVNNENIVFDRNIWKNVLLTKNSHQSEFLSFFMDFFNVTKIYYRALENLNEDIFKRLKIFLYDLSSSEDYIDFRLNQRSLYFFQYCLSRYYFTEEEIEYLLNFPTLSGLILKDRLDLIIKEKFRFSSKDLFPILIKVFQLKRDFLTSPSSMSKYANLSRNFKGIL
jgi:hypothetical protein